MSALLALFLAVGPLDLPAPAGALPPASLPADTVESHWAVAGTGNEARYLVREQLAGFDLPNDAVGVTSAVTGAIRVSPEGGIVREGSWIEIDLTTLATDQERRDGYVQRNTLKTEEFPRAVFVPTGIEGGLLPLAEGASTEFRMIGELTLLGTTRTIVWDASATREGNVVTGTARTSFPFEDFGIAKPSVARVLSVADDIRLEYDFRLERR